MVPPSKPFGTLLSKSASLKKVPISRVVTTIHIRACLLPTRYRLKSPTPHSFPAAALASRRYRISDRFLRLSYVRPMSSPMQRNHFRPLRRLGSRDRKERKREKEAKRKRTGGAPRKDGTFTPLSPSFFFSRHFCSVPPRRLSSILFSGVCVSNARVVFLSTFRSIRKHVALLKAGRQVDEGGRKKTLSFWYESTSLVFLLFALETACFSLLLVLPGARTSIASVFTYGCRVFVQARVFSREGFFLFSFPF